jgi:hypothetical protein
MIMSRSVLLVAVALLLVSFVGSAPADLLSDPDFEESGDSAWDPYRSTTSFDFDFDNTDQVQNGLESLRIFFSPMDAWQIFEAKQDIPVTGGQDWSASVYAMTDISGAPSLQVYLETLFYSNSVELVGMNLQSSVLTDSTLQNEWQLLNVSGSVPAVADSARFRLVVFNTGDPITGSGSVWFDNATVAIPEPSTLALIGLSSAALVLLRKNPKLNRSGQ